MASKAMALDLPQRCYTWMAINELVQRSCESMDFECFEDWLGLFHPEGRYEIRVYSPELRREMIWLDNTVAEMRALLENVPNHLRDTGTYMRSATLRSVTSEDGLVRSQSTLIVHKTDISGSSDLYACGQYHDEWLAETTDAIQLRRRVVRLNTRVLGTGSHVPL